MHRFLRMSCVKIGKASIYGNDCTLLRSLLVPYVCTRRDNSSSSGSTPTESSAPAQDSPNQTVVIDTTTAESFESVNDSRNTKKLPSLLKTAEEDIPDLNFATLFRRSKFAHLGSSKGKIVHGRIFRVVDNNLYVDFDWKFPCVLRRPAQDAHLYVNNSVVQLRIIDLEMSTIFLGAAKETSLNEANCALIGLVSSPLGEPSSQAR